MAEVMQLLEAAGAECYSRKQWGSPQERAGAYARRRQTHPMPNRKAKYHFLHITVTADTDTVAEGKDGARRVESYGLSTPPMVSYQALVTNEGRWFEGQNYGVKGTHTINDKGIAGFPRDLNAEGYAVAIMQNVGDPVTDVQVQLIAMTFAAAELAGKVEIGAPIYPHRVFAWKSCPGDKAVARLPEIQRLKDQFVRDGLRDPEYPIRVQRSLEQLQKHLDQQNREIKRLRAAREVAKRRSEPRKQYTEAIKAIKLARKNTRQSIKHLRAVQKR